MSPPYPSRPSKRSPEQKKNILYHWKPGSSSFPTYVLIIFFLFERAADIFPVSRRERETRRTLRWFTGRSTESRARLPLYIYIISLPKGFFSLCCSQSHRLEFNWIWTTLTYMQTKFVNIYKWMFTCARNECLIIAGIKQLQVNWETECLFL